MRGVIVLLLGVVLLCFFHISCAVLIQLGEGDEIELQHLSEEIKDKNDGGIVYIKPGEYRDLNVRINRKFEQEVTIRPKTPGTVRLTGSSTFVIFNSENIKIEGFLFDEVSGNSIVIDDSRNIAIEDNYFYQCGSAHTNSIIVLRNDAPRNKMAFNTFDGNKALGVTINTSKDNIRDERNVENEITNNYFVNIPSVKSVYPQSNGNGMEAIRIGLDNEETIGYELKTKVSENLFENIIGDGVEIISNKSSANEISNNTFLNNRSGITIRSGNGVIVKGNYLENTSRGIRIYGADHVISRNYIKNALFGISLPSADFMKGGGMPRNGYYQQENLAITDNVIDNPTNEGFLIGSGERELLPENINISRNQIYIRGKAKDMNVSERMGSRRVMYSSNETFFDEEETYLSTSKSRLTEERSSYRLLNKEQKASVEEIVGHKPYGSNDKRVGAKWRRPSIL